MYIALFVDSEERSPKNEAAFEEAIRFTNKYCDQEPQESITFAVVHILQTTKQGGKTMLNGGVVVKDHTYCAAEKEAQATSVILYYSKLASLYASRSMDIKRVLLRTGASRKHAAQEWMRNRRVDRVFIGGTDHRNKYYKKMLNLTGMSFSDQLRKVCQKDSCPVEFNCAYITQDKCSEKNISATFAEASPKSLTGLLGISPANGNQNACANGTNGPSSPISRRRSADVVGRLPPPTAQLKPSLSESHVTERESDLIQREAPLVIGSA